MHKNNANETATARTNIAANSDYSNAKRVCINIMAIADTIVIAKRRVYTNIIITTRELTKNRVDAKVMAMINETATANTKKPVTNARIAHTNVKAIAVANVKTTINKTTSDTKKAHANVIASNNNRNVRKARINKVVTVNEDNARRVRTNIMATANAIVKVKRRTDINVVRIANIMDNNARAGTILAVTIN